MLTATSSSTLQTPCCPPGYPPHCRPNVARHVILHIADPCFLSCTASHDAVSIICQARRWRRRWRAARRAARAATAAAPRATAQR